jgi:hypothetical protein
MSVYEATTDAQSQKIVSFLQAQPSAGYAATCYKQLLSTAGLSILSATVFSSLISKFPGLQIFVCEDESASIRVVWGKQIIPNTLVSVVIFGFMSETDYTSGNIQYFKQLCVWLLQNESAGVLQHFSNYVTNATYLNFVQQIFGIAVTVLGSMQIAGTTMYQLVIDVKTAKSVLGIT